MSDAIVERIERALGVEGLAERLADAISASDLQSLLQAVYARRAHARTPADVLREHETSRFARPSAIPATAFTRIEQLAWDRLPAGFEPVECSPLAPLGSCSAIGAVHQNKIVSALRGEVTADVTNALVLECALRRREALRGEPRSRERIRLAAHQRVTRAQYVDAPGSFAHFRTLCCVTAGRDEGNRIFERDALAEQLGFLCDVILAASRRPAASLRVTLTPLEEARFGAAVEDWASSLLSARLVAGVRVEIDRERDSGRGYYRDLCFKIFLLNREGVEVELGDGGPVDWTRRLLGSRKERCLISGIGVDRLALLTGDR